MINSKFIIYLQQGYQSMDNDESAELFTHWQRVARSMALSNSDNHPMRIPPRFLPASDCNKNKNGPRKSNNELLELHTQTSNDEQCWQCSRTTKI